MRGWRRLREGATYLAVVLAGLAVGATLLVNLRADLALAREHYRESAHTQAARVAARVRDTFRDTYQGLRTIARLPAVREVDRHGVRLRGDARVATQEVYNNLAGNVAVSELYLLPVDFDPDAIDPATGEAQRPIATFDELIVGRTADGGSTPARHRDAALVEEIEIHEWRLMREQLATLRERYPVLDDVSGLAYPALGGREVLTCDNTRYSPAHPDDDMRSGIVYSVPFYGLDGTLAGMVSAVILTPALRDLLPDGEHALVNAAWDHVVLPWSAGQAQRSAALVARGEPDPGLVYSEVLPVGNADDESGWLLWAGLPNERLDALPEVRAARRFAAVGASMAGVLTLAGLGYVRAVHRSSARLEHEVEQRTRELRIANGRLRRARAAERRFTGDAAHELRTPLAAIRAQADVARDASSPARRDRALAQLALAVERAGRLVEQLLALARADAALPLGEGTTVDLAATVRDALGLLAARLEAHDVAVTVAAPARAMVVGEPVMLEALARNLLDNAIRYGAPRARVEVELTRERDGLWLVVRDEGPGFARADLERATDRFYRAPDAAASGAGLGLSIAARVAAVHGARLRVGNRPGRRGAEVSAGPFGEPPGA